MSEDFSVVAIPKKCKTCKFFLRGHWVDGEPQNGGSCEVLLAALKMMNASLWRLENLHVQDNFGCAFHKDSEDESILEAGSISLIESGKIEDLMREGLESLGIAVREFVATFQENKKP